MPGRVATAPGGSASDQETQQCLEEDHSESGGTEQKRDIGPASGGSETTT